MTCTSSRVLRINNKFKASAEVKEAVKACVTVVGFWFVTT
jgi:hypothetical protein